MITAPRQILFLGLMLAALIAVAATLSAQARPRGPVGISAPTLTRSGEPVASISRPDFDLRWGGTTITLASR
ncbi:hypothetical protein [Salinarimonas soli]|uniref:Uncharacterized protein n=1 Tax=Salinarimonas soli TaxID=1638099 RepID=A0A5B2V9E7_9HYPH|nr:hypothetical protein [Salinarimonas soli]KAA2236123.1 hypothetical protein F0L46_15510 [Salinarimonas soli]